LLSQLLSMLDNGCWLLFAIPVAGDASPAFTIAVAFAVAVNPAIP
jgi:hypothetical protein